MAALALALPLTAISAAPAQATGTAVATVTTVVPDASHTVISAPLLAPVTAHAQVTVSGSGAVPTGTVTVRFYAEHGGCGPGAPTSTTTVSLDATGVAHLSTAHGPLGPGTYGFYAEYSGDAVYAPATGFCAAFTVAQETPTVTTVLHDASHNAITGPVLAPGFAHAQATVTGTAGVPTGTVTFSYYANQDFCAGVPTSATTVALDASGVAHPSATQGPLGPGRYAWRVQYNGNTASPFGPYAAASGGCRVLDVIQQTPTVAMTLHDAGHTAITAPVLAPAFAHASAAVSGTAGVPAGTVTFSYYANQDFCAGVPTSASTVALDASGVAHPSAAHGPLGPGKYAWRAQYNGNTVSPFGPYAPASGGCRVLEVIQLAPTVSITVHDASHAAITSPATVGVVAHAQATVSGTAGVPTGTVTFRFYLGRDFCAGVPSSQTTVALDANGVAHPSAAQGPLAAGFHAFRADYSGNPTAPFGPYQAAGSSCAVFQVGDLMPVANAGGPYTVAEGGSVALAGTGTDPNNMPLNFAWDLDGDQFFEIAGQAATFSAATMDGPGTGTARLRVCNAYRCAFSTATVTVTNVAPTIVSLASPIDPQALSSPVAVSVAYTDPSAADTHTVTFDWGDGTSSTAAGAAGSGGAAHTYASPGSYTVTVTVTDDDGDSDSATALVVVHAPGDGKVTGGGWIDDVGGRATFTVDSKYLPRRSMPSGTVRFRNATLSFEADTQDWLIVSGVEARIAGTGRVNGVGGYRFVVVVRDGGEPSRSVDRFGIRIWDATGVVHDSGAAGIPLSGGNVQVHR